MNYLKKFYDLLGSEHGKIRPIINEDSLPVSKTLPNKNEINSTQGVLITPIGAISIDQDKSLVLNGKPLHIVGQLQISNRFVLYPFGNNPKKEMDVINAKNLGDKLLLKVKTSPQYLKSEKEKKQDVVKDITVGYGEIEKKLKSNAKYVSLTDNTGETYELFYKNK